MEMKEPIPIDIIHTLMQSSNFVQREFQTRLATFDAPFQLTGPRIRILTVVSNKGVIRMNELAQILGVKARSVTDFVDALEREELLTRLPDPNDRRATLLKLTNLAEEYLAEAIMYQHTIAEHLLRNIPHDQRAVLLDLLVKLNTCNEKKNM